MDIDGRWLKQRSHRGRLGCCCFRRRWLWLGCRRRRCRFGNDDRQCGGVIRIEYWRWWWGRRWYIGYFRHRQRGFRSWRFSGDDGWSYRSEWDSWGGRYGHRRWNKSSNALMIIRSQETNLFVNSLRLKRGERRWWWIFVDLCGRSAK